MDLEKCFKVHNLFVIHLNNSKLGEMTNLKMVFCMVVSIYKLDKFCNLTQSPAQPQNGLFNGLTRVLFMQAITLNEIFIHVM